MVRPWFTAGRMERREFLRALVGAGAVLALPGCSGGGDGSGGGPSGVSSSTDEATRLYGPLQEPDANGIRLPRGFTSREVARSGEPVAGTDHMWHVFPDGGATFAADDGGWIYVSNSEVPGTGGVGAIRFAPDGAIADAYPILEGTSVNCAGGATPWGTWLSCEEHGTGRVYECDPTGGRPAVARPALGTFRHEAAAVDPGGRALYLTEDEPDGRLYRFVPESWPELAAGRLEVAEVARDGTVGWLPVPDPDAGGGTRPTRTQVPASTPFNGGEGMWWDEGTVYFTTKGDHRVWAYDIDAGRLNVLYDAATAAEAPLRAVDNVTVADRSGDVYVAEDGDNMELVLITDERVVPFLRVVGQPDSEIAGPAFDPEQRRLYFSSQRGNSAGITYEVTGPFRVTRDP
jgi:uncharacterized protein